MSPGKPAAPRVAPNRSLTSVSSYRRFQREASKRGPFRYRFRGRAPEKSLRRVRSGPHQDETAMRGQRREMGGGGQVCYPEARQRRRTLDGRVQSSVTAQVPNGVSHCRDWCIGWRVGPGQTERVTRRDARA